MKKVYLIILLVFFTTSIFSQIKFETGYFIDNEGNKVECLIKNYDWRKNPTEIEYKSDETSDSKLINVVSLKEFGINYSSKYIALTVKIDRSSSQLSELSTSSEPAFAEEKLFLKVLVEGKANLYSYEDRNLKRFFFSIDEAPIEQLIFKQYLASNSIGNSNKVSKNTKFRQQLWNSLTCSSIDRKKFENLNYEKKELMNVFNEYNTCTGSKSKTFEIKQQIFTLSIRPRLNHSSLRANNPLDQSSNFDWGNKVGFGVGLEGEFILPMNNNKWSVLIETAYQSFSARATANDYSSPGSIFIGQADYKSIELPVGARRYFSLNDKSKFFVNASVVFDFLTSPSQINITRGSGYQISNLKISGGSNLAFGGGLKHKAFGIEVRYQTTRDPLNNYRLWESEYKTISVILGYSIARKKTD